jgi:hypothetical protein
VATAFAFVFSRRSLADAAADQNRLPNDAVLAATPDRTFVMVEAEWALANGRDHAQSSIWWGILAGRLGKCRVNPPREKEIEQCRNNLVS